MHVVAFTQHQKQHQWKWLLTILKTLLVAYSVWKSWRKLLLKVMHAAPDQAETIIAEGLAKVEAVAKELSAVLV